MEHRLEELLTAMTSPDPKVRDGWAYQELAQGILSGLWDSSLPTIEARAVEHLNHPDIQARSFAPLILCWVIQAGGGSRHAFEACRSWYLQEEDNRAYDPRLGWLHAVAHGADCLAEYVRVGLAEPTEVLETLAQKLVTSDQPWSQQEEARLVRAVKVSLSGDTQATAQPWFNLLEEAIKTAEQAETIGASPVWFSNLRSVLSLSYVTAAEALAQGSSQLTRIQEKSLQEESLRLLTFLLPWLLSPEEESR